MIRMLRRFVFNLTTLTVLGLLLNHQQATGLSAAKPSSAPALQPLTIELHNARALPGKTPAISVDFVMKNNTNEPITLVDRRNSWGAHQWEYEITDATGKKFVVINPQFCWTRNGLSFFEVEPGYEFRLPSFLEYLPNSTYIGVNEFVDERNRLVEMGLSMMDEKGKCHEIQPDKGPAWKYPLSVVGKFTAKMEEGWENESQRVRRSSWAGTIRTAPITVEAPTTP